MPLLNPPLPELNHTDVRLYFDLDPYNMGLPTGQYLMEILFKPGIKLISQPPSENFIPYHIPEGASSNLIDSFELITSFEHPGYQEKTLLVMLGYSYQPDSTEPPQDKILIIHFREMGMDQLIDSKTKVLYYLKAKDKPKRINYIEPRPHDD